MIGIDWCRRVDWGSVPDWVAALGTVGALLWAVWVFQRELKRRHEERKEAQKDQARLVAAWREGAAIEAPNPAAPVRFRIRVVNRSDLPVYSALIRLEWDGQSGSDHSVISTVPPLSDTTHICSIRWDVAATHSFPIVSLAFTDAGGRVWRKYGDGKLEAGSWDH